MTLRLRRGPLARLALGAVAYTVVAAGGLAGQQGCQFVEGSGNLSTVDVGGSSVTYVTTPNLSCRDGVRIRADSAVAFEASNYVQLIGRVRFEDPERRLTAQDAEYFTTVGRLQAHRGAEIVQKRDSSRVRGDEMVYNRPDESRPRAQLDVYGDRPTARLYLGGDTTGTGAARSDSARAPYDIEADRIVIEADSYFRARGEVKVVRESDRGGAPLQAFGDSVEYDQTASVLRLMGRARMRIDERDLTAELITAELPGDEVREVIARRKAVVAAEDIRIRAPLVHVFFEEGAMERLVAVPLTAPAPTPPVEPSADLPAAQPPPTLSEEDRARPVATAESFTIVADSLDVLAPGEVLDQIHAVGGARAESSARDSLNTADTPKLARTDWMEGDTIVAQFAPVAPDSAAPAPDSAAPRPDSTRARYRLESLSAVGKARTLYRMEPSDSARARGSRHPAIHYVAATSIVLDWNDGEIRGMEVQGQTEGVHAEPDPAAPDTSRAVPPDSARAPSDTTRAVGAIGVASTEPRPVPRRSAPADARALPSAPWARVERRRRRGA